MSNEDLPSDLCKTIKKPFILKPDGVYFEKNIGNGDFELHPVCSYLVVTAQTRSKDGDAWGRILGWIDLDGRKHSWPMPMSLLASEGNLIREHLLDRGLRIFPSRNSNERILQYIASCEPILSILCVNRIGWHKLGDQYVFVLPDIAFGTSDRVCLQNYSLSEHAFNMKGSLEDWKIQIAKYAIGNPFLILSICCSFGAPLLDIANAESGGFNIFGPSSTGKTTVLQVGSSVWGGDSSNHRGFIKQWRATGNGLESIAAQHCDAALFLDEMSQANSKEVGEVVYMLGNETGKVRAKQDGSMRKPSKWRILFVSSGETDLVTKISESSSGRPLAGQEVRLVDIPVTTEIHSKGIFHELHGFDSGEKLSNYLKEASKNQFGYPIQAFLEHISTIERDELSKQINEMMQLFVGILKLDKPDGQVLRVAARFGLLAAAGSLAVNSGVVPWSIGDVIFGVKSCFDQWLVNRGSTTPKETQNLISQVKHFFQMHGDSRFTDLGNKEPIRTINRAGFKEHCKESTIFYVLSEVFKKELCNGYSDGFAKKTLLDHGYLIEGHQKSNSKYQIKKRIPGFGSKLVYQFSDKVLGED